MKITPKRVWLLVALGVLACGSSDQGRNSRLKSVSRTTSALEGSATLAKALTGKIRAIKNAPGNLISLGMPGDAGVGDDGAASYRLPIWVPDGVNGLEPSLAAEYDSGDGRGILGPRWRLSGLSAITRCAKTRAQDGAPAPVNFFGDTFCLDGQRLMRLGTTNEFRTEHESFQKIVGTQAANGDWLSFKVYHRDGRISFFGSSLLSRLHGNPKRMASSERDVAYAYYVDKVEDRYGNAIAIWYANAQLSALTGVTVVQELVPSSITWGPTNERSVTFDYEPLPGGATVNSQVRWVHGLGIGMSQYLTSITVKGPDGFGLLPVLKKYNFTYDTNAWPNGPAVITGEKYLSTISECDGTGVCKKPTTIRWEAGVTTANVRSLPVPGVYNSQLGNPPVYDGGLFLYLTGHGFKNVAKFVDLNDDGLDDVVYRDFVPPHHAGYKDCLGWAARLAVLTPGDTSGIPTLGPEIPLTHLGGDPDYMCRAYLWSEEIWRFGGVDGHRENYTPPWGGPTAYPGDLVFADLDGDGYPDILSPVGHSGTEFTTAGIVRYASLSGYRAYLNKVPASGNLDFGPPINFLDTIGQLPSGASFYDHVGGPDDDHASKGYDAMLGVGDIDGDGLLDVLRPNSPGSLQLSAASITAASLSPFNQTVAIQGLGTWQFPAFQCTASACRRSIQDAVFPGGGTAWQGLDVVDLDGDGIAEILRSAPCPSGMTCDVTSRIVDVRSPTITGAMPFPPLTKGGENAQRWYLDLNGDGLTDIAWVGAPSDTVWTSINSGNGFGAIKSTPKPSGFCELWPAHARVIDYNLDGRDDLLAKGSTTSTNCTWGTKTPKSVVLLSDGTGGFVPLPVDLPAYVPESFTASNEPREEIVADLNADGMPDVVYQEQNDYDTADAYIRQGSPPGMVTKIEEGNGRFVEYKYDVANERDGQFYSVAKFLTCDKDRQRLECLNRGRWLTRELTVAASPTDPPLRQTFKYRGGVSDKHGRGFLGFLERQIIGPGSNRTTITYDPITRTASGNRYVYMGALDPTVVRSELDQAEGPNRHRVEIVSKQTSGGQLRADGTWLNQPSLIRHMVQDCPPVGPGGTCSDGARVLSMKTEQPTFDAYGNVTKLVTSYADENEVFRTDTDETKYLPANESSWLLTLFDPDPTKPATRTSVITSPVAETVTRTFSITSDTVRGDITSIEYEPGGTADVRLKRTFSRDTRGRVYQQDDLEVLTGANRRTTFQFQDADGVYASSVTRHASTAAGPFDQTTRIFTHPGLGLVVETVDPNNLAATRTYDTFGRPLTETDIAGATTTTSYLDSAEGGMTLTVTPPSMTARTIHLDSFGRETLLTTPVDASRMLLESRLYDGLGRITNRTISSKSLTAPVQLNSYNYTYDDLDRLISECHLTSDSLNRCRTTFYDGLAATMSDENGRTVKNISDAMGRPSRQEAILQVGNQTLTTFAFFEYGAFGVLKREVTSDGSGQTGFTYDVLGRQRSITRTNIGARRTSYNAFGDTIETLKGSEAKPIEKLTHGRDAFGRITSVTGDGISRTFHWDAAASSPTTPAPNAKGKLVDVKDGTSTQIHYDYGSNGLVSKKTWSASTWTALTEVGSAGYEYDKQGRLAKLTYPKVGNWSDPLVLLYGYDPYLGDASSIMDASDTTIPIWSVASRDHRGQVNYERMYSPSTGYFQRAPSYYSTTGLLSAVWYDQIAPSGSFTWGILGYQYDAAGLPSASQQAGDGIAGQWNSSFTHDNLGRLTRWGTAKCCNGFDVGVSYSYDVDGNLTGRGWGHPGGGGSLTFGTTTDPKGNVTRTVAFNGSAGPGYTEEYRGDPWGRIFDTPAVTLAYNAADEVTSITEKANGQVDSFYRDGFGNRIVTTYGDPFNGQPWSELFTFDELTEIRNGSSGTEERCKLRANGKLIGELVRTGNTAIRTATFYVTDAVGSVVAEASSSGITVRARRDPFGSAVPSSETPDIPKDPAAANQDGSGRLAFAGHARDNNLGLVDMGARFYSPRLGRFMSPDSVIGNAFDRRSYNPFAYAWNSPVAMNDPSGRNPFPVVAVLTSVWTALTGGSNFDNTVGLPPSILNGGGGGPGFLPEEYAQSGGQSSGEPEYRYGPPAPPRIIVTMPDNVATTAPTSPNSTRTVATGSNATGATESNRGTSKSGTPRYNLLLGFTSNAETTGSDDGSAHASGATGPIIAGAGITAPKTKGTILDRIRAWRLSRLLRKAVDIHSTSAKVVDGVTQVEKLSDRSEKIAKELQQISKGKQKGPKLRGGFDPISALFSLIDDYDVAMTADENGTTFEEEHDKKHENSKYFRPLGLPLPLPNTDYKDIQ